MNKLMRAAIVAVVMGAAACGAEGEGAEVERLERTDAASKAECPAGGSVVSRGDDEDGDGVLDDSEIDERELQCEPLRQATRIVAVAPGAQCVGGGVAQQRGLDRNGNEVLDDDEVTETLYVCSTVVGFDVTVRTGAEVAALAQITEIQGNLVIQMIDEDAGRELSLPALRKVTGSVTFGQDSQLNTVAMPELVEVGGGFSVGTGGPNRLRALSFPKLVMVGGTFMVRGCAALVVWPEFPALERVGGDFVVVSNPELKEVRAPKQRIAGAVAVQFNPQLEKIDLRLIEGAGDVEVRSNIKLAEVRLAATGSAASAGFGAVKVEGNALLERVTLAGPQLGSVRLASNPLLASSSITAEKVTGSVEVAQQGNGALTVAPLSSSSAVVTLGGLRLSGPLQSLGITGGRLRVEGAVRIAETALVRLEGVERVGGRFDLLSNPLLTAVAPVSFFGGEVQVYDNDVLTRADFVTQAELFGTLVFSSNPALVSVQGSLENLQTVHGSLLVLGNDVLTAVISPVSQIDGRLALDGNDRLALVQLNNLPQLTRLSVQRGYALPALVLPALHTVEEIVLVSNVGMTQVSLPALTTATRLEGRGNSQLPTCQLQALCDRFGLTGSSCVLEDNGTSCP